MKTRLSLLLVMLLIIGGTAFGQYIEIRVSVKVIRDPVSNAWPTDITEGLFRPISGSGNKNAQDSANEWMTNFSRGYRFRITEVIGIGGPSEQGPNGSTCYYGTDTRASGNGPSCWFGRGDARNDPAFNTAIKANPALFKLRSDQVNFYVAVGKASPSGSGGACPIPPGEASATWCHGFVNEGGWWLVHETGHFFGLCHTQDVCGRIGTLPDNENWTRDQIATNAYGVPYNSLPDDKKKLVDDTYYNVMSYHEAPQKDLIENRMTEAQLDLHADTANSTRAPFVSGKTRFVSTTGSDSSSGGSGSPYRSVTKAVTISNPAGGDIILLRPGAYNEIITINKAVTLRAGRTGQIKIGSPTPP